MTAAFGTPDPAYPRLPTRRSRIPPGLLLEVIDDAVEDLPDGALSIRVLDRFGADPLLSVEEGERRTRLDVAELARDMERARVPDSPPSVRAAFQAWIGQRPVCDADAAAAGVAVCGWATDRGSDRVSSPAPPISWQVVVRRGEALGVWRPSVLATPAAVAASRAASMRRSLRVEVDMHVTGAVVVWTCAEAPAMASALLASPERMLDRMGTRRLGTEDVSVVVSPPHPVVCAPARVARRLAGESDELHVTLPWAGFGSLGWT